jgi:hypothetical protein
MPQLTPKLGIKKPLGNETVSRAAFNENWDIIDENAASQADFDTHKNATTDVHGATSAATPNTIIQRDANGRAKVAAPSAGDDIARKDTVDKVQTNLDNHIADYVRQPGYAVATGSDNTYSVTLSPAPTEYMDGMAIAVKINVDNTGASTLNVNGLGAKAIKKSNGNDVSAGNLKANSVYTLRYNGTNFILQGEGGGGGNAQPSDVLSGKTFTNDAGEQTGTMPERGNVNATLTSQGQVYTIPNGYHAGSGEVTANITNLTAANIKYGARVGGVAGTFSQTSSAPAAGEILTGKVAFANGAQITGSMPNRAGDTAALSSVVSGTTLKLLASQGYRDGVDDYVTITDPDFIASNIRSGVNLFGLVGTLIEGKRWATGTATRVDTYLSFVSLSGSTVGFYYIEVTGLAFGFMPSVIIVYPPGSMIGNPGFVTIYTSFPTGFRTDLGNTSNIAVATGPDYRAYFIQNVSPAYVTSTGFRLPVESASTTLGKNWIAFE